LRNSSFGVSVGASSRRSDQVFQNFDINIGIAKPYPNGVEELESLPYETTYLSREHLRSYMEKYFNQPPAGGTCQ